MKFAVLSVKFIPIIVTIALIFQCVLALLDIDISMKVSTIYGHSLLYNSLLLILSKVFRFCWWHRVIILNLMAINAVEWIDKNLFSFNPLNYVWMLIMMLSTTILASAYLYSISGSFKGK